MFGYNYVHNVDHCRQVVDKNSKKRKQLKINDGAERGGVRHLQ